MGGGIDPGLVWNGALSVVVAVGAFMGSRYAKRQDDQDSRIRSLEIDLPKNYVSRQSLSEQLKRIEGDIREMKNLLLNKAIDEKKDA